MSYSLNSLKGVIFGLAEVSERQRKRDGFPVVFFQYVSFSKFFKYFLPGSSRISS